MELARKTKFLEEQRTKKRVRIGKQPMFMSAKPVKAKKKEEKKIDPEKQAFLDYIGVLEEGD